MADQREHGPSLASKDPSDRKKQTERPLPAGQPDPPEVKEPPSPKPAPAKIAGAGGTG